MRSFNSGNVSEVFDLFFIDKLFWFRNIGDEKTNSDLRSWFLIVPYLQEAGKIGFETEKEAGFFLFV